MKHRHRRLRRAGALVTALFLGWGTVALYAVHPALPYSPVRLPGAAAIRTQLVLPEGWAFFTRDPREPRAYVYVRAEGGWRSESADRIADPRYLFGLDRSGRVEGPELGHLLAQVPPGAWRECAGADAECLDRQEPAARVRPAVARPRFCGRVGVVQRPPVPWAWSRAETPVRMPTRTLTLDVVC